jgi:threonylcarbamoyladenosine tRNA methylthiotransferase MtaB
MGSFHVENFGCRAARADGEAISARLHCMERSLGFDVVVVNTCSVTAEADREARAYIRRTHRANPEVRIVVTGCYAQRAPEELAALPGVAVVVGNSHKALAPEIVLELANTSGAKAPFQPAPEIAGAKAPAYRSVSRERSKASAYRSASGDCFEAPRESQKADVRAEGRSLPLLPVSSLLVSGVPVWVDDRFAHSFLEEAQLVPGEQTRPNLKIQEGCGNRCTFCVIPTTRGPSRSLAAESVLKQVRGFVAAGGNELVLSGINLGRWGRDRVDGGAPAPNADPTLSHKTRKDGAPDSLAGLVRRVFAETELPWLRLSSIEPMDWDDELIGLMAEFGGSRLCRHAHLPLQSGSDAVLRRMHRRYRPWHYAEKAAALFRAAGPVLTLGADVMVGFPGETDAEFEETLELVRALPFGYLHLFPFSPRPGTRGWALHEECPIAARAVEERMSALRVLAAEKTRAHREQFIGRELDAITLNTSGGIVAQGRTQALSENFLPIEVEGDLPANRMVRVRVDGMSPKGTLTAAI